MRRCKCAASAPYDRPHAPLPTRTCALTHFLPLPMLDNLKNLGGLGNLGGLMAKAKEMQAKMEQMQADLASKRATADAGAGIVEATVNGKLELVKVRIDRGRLGTPGAEKLELSGEDVEMLEDLLVAAVAAAQAKAADLAKAEMAKMAGDLGLPPGMLPGA